mgnify:CR=1 FL=1
MIQKKLQITKTKRLLRRKRLAEIRAAHGDLESALLILRDSFKVMWTGPSFAHLYWLIRLARQVKL